jgi:NAD(P)-dependent dehydrogenase (short-subunit alcohol dehydrogenase family)
VLINNAGALFNEHTMTSEGLEKSYALLLLSPWRLSERLLPLLQSHDTTARIINVVSGGMYAERLNLRRLNMTSDGYRGARAYAQCKRALSIMTEIWAERWREHNIVVNAMHPGWSDTPGGSEIATPVSATYETGASLTCRRGRYRGLDGAGQSGCPVNR